MGNKIGTIRKISNDTEYQDLHDAKFEYNFFNGWSMNQAALDAINSVIIGVRDGWFAPVLMDDDSGENEFLSALNLLEFQLNPLGIFIEPGVFHKRKIQRSKENRFSSEPIEKVTSNVKFIPTQLFTKFIIFFGISRNIATQLHDCYFENYGARYRIYDSGMLSSNHKKIFKKMCDSAVIEASIIGVPLGVIDYYIENLREKLCWLPQGRLYGATPPKSIECPPWRKFLFWHHTTGMEDPYDLEIESLSRDAAIACMNRMNSDCIWIPKRWPTC